MRSAEQSILIQAPPKQVFDVLSDYDSYQEWMPNLVRSRAFAEEGDIIVYVECVLNYKGKEYSFVLEFTSDGQRIIRYRQIKVEGIKDISGEWALSETPEGVLVTGSVYVSMGLSIPKILVRRICRRLLREVLEAAKDRAMLHATPEEVLLNWEDGDEEKVRKLCRVIRQGDGVIHVWLLGKQYELRPVDREA